MIIPCVAEVVPKPRNPDARGTEFAANAAAKDIAYAVYEIKTNRGIKYQPHPAFARDANGDLGYSNLSEDDLADKNLLADFRAGAR